MSYLLDTNILSAHLRRPAGLQHRFVQHAGREDRFVELFAEAFGVEKVQLGVLTRCEGNPQARG